jgi:CHAD domain-containing protein
MKLAAEPGFVLPDLGGRPLTPRTVTSTYFDTPDRRLFRSGITLRRRVENRAGVWQLRLPSENGRCELEERGGPRVPAAFDRLLVAPLHGTSLEPAAKLRTRRDGVSVGPRSDRVEVVVDTVSVLEDRHVVDRFVEVEAEVAGGPGSALDAVAKALRKAGATPDDGTSKLARMLGPPPQREAEDDDPVGRLRRLLVEQYEAILANDPGVRLGEDIEALHQMRVATRRSRALLRAAHGLVAAEWAEPLREELSWLGGLLGPVRDLDVLLEHLDADAAALDGEDVRAFRRLRARLVRERADGRAVLLEGLDSERYFRLLDTLAGAAHAPAGGYPTPLEEIAGRAFAKLEERVAKLPKTPSDAQLHRVRIEAKRARYAAELAAPVLGKSGKKILDAAKELQDVIGEHQDAHVAEERLRALAERGGGRTGLAAGRLIERQRRRKRSARRDYPDAWQRLKKAGRAAFC